MERGNTSAKNGTLKLGDCLKNKDYAPDLVPFQEVFKIASGASTKEVEILRLFLQRLFPRIITHISETGRSMRMDDGSGTAVIVIVPKEL